MRVARGSENVDLFAKKIVSDVGVINTFKKLLPIDVAKKSCECTEFLSAGIAQPRVDQTTVEFQRKFGHM